MKNWAAWATLLWAGAVAAAPGDTTLIDDFRDASRWLASASDQVASALRRDAGGALCLDYDFRGVSGYAVARRTIDLPLPDNYEFRLRLSGQGPANHFQFKLSDASGDNVWWLQQPNVRYLPQPRELRIRQRQIQFAWGPTADKRLRRPQALELVVASGSGGGRGALCFEQLTLVERAPVPAEWPQPHLAMAGPGIEIDLGALREFSGLQLQWPAPPGSGHRPRDYAIEADDGSGQWRMLTQVRRAAGPLDALHLPEAEARRLRLRALDAQPQVPLARPAITLADASAWRSPDDATAARAKALPRGAFPRAYLGEQNYWALFGVDRGARFSGLISEDGAIEPAPGKPSIEPFVLLESGRGKRATRQLVSWADVAISHHLPDGYLPQPRVRWTHAAFTLDIEAAASGDARQATGLARYTLRATEPKGRTTRRNTTRLNATLLLVTRPWQVNPPQQFLNLAGGSSVIRALQWQDGALWVNNVEPQVHALPAPARAVGGGGADWPLAMALARGDAGQPLPEDPPWFSPDGLGEGALAWPLVVAPGQAARTALAWPMVGEFAPPRTLAEVDAAFDASAAAWRERLNRVGLQLPAEGQRVHDTLRSALAQILLSRDGPALQPGTRSYARAWVRDGAMMVAGLLRLGEVQAAEEFVDWYQTKLFASGKVPCCVDARGADPVPENDSHGQFVYAVAELWRFTRDRAALERRWPAVERATRYMETLRQSTRTEANRANRAPGNEAFFGLMPASISHEGYSEKPMHSYWDDFWALRGYKDAVHLAEALGHSDDARQFTAWRDEFATELAASIRTAVTARDIAYVPGAAELGDFDPTSTTVALNPAQAQGLLPPGLLQATFERYWHESQTRARGERDWKDYTPYELRSVGALVRLGKPARALAMLDFFFADQRPAGWNQWAEVVMRGYRTPKFLGDMPHAWVASDAIRSLLDLFVHEEGDALVLGAGLPDAWLGEAGVAVRALPTPGGPLSYRMKRGPSGLQVDIDAGPVPPPGGLKVRWHGREHRIERLPASITLED
ncbi:MAG: coagulation factor 5/8 type domain-containing protein [Pseudomonadota bacterium]